MERNKRNDEYIKEMIRKSRESEPKKENTLQKIKGHYKQLIIELDGVFKGDRSVYYKIGYFLWVIIVYLMGGITILTYCVFPVLLIAWVIIQSFYGYFIR